jgi:hypothetical protein
LIIKKGKFEVPYFVYKLENESVREKLLYALSSTKSYKSSKPYELLQKSDWDYNKNPADFQRNFINSNDSNYYNILKPHLDLIIDDLNKFDKKTSLFVSQGWFHQYTKLNWYFYHWHPGARWALVYYVELPKDGPKTEFESITGSPVSIDVEQGDILVFPGWIKHRSPPNMSDSRKTIIAFNIVEK